MIRYVLVVVFGLISPALAQTVVSVPTYHYDNARTGQNTQETILTPQAVSSGQFGKLFFHLLDQQAYAQPLYVANLALPNNGTHNVVFVATEADSMYAFDADNASGANELPLWHVNLLDAQHGALQGSRPVLTGANGDLKNSPVGSSIGITSTPVIDPSTNTMYAEAFSVETLPPSLCVPTQPKAGAYFVHRLHALDITSGAEKFGGPMPICGPNGFNSNGPTSGNGNQLNRPGLLLSGGNIYLGYASDGQDGNDGNYHGWLFAYNARSLAQVAVLETTPNGVTANGCPVAPASDYAGAGGIWMTGAGLAADSAGNLFVATGNGTFDTTLNSQGFPVNNDFADSILKLNSTLSVMDYFAPANEYALDCADIDLGSGGVLLLPDQPGPNPHLLVQAGKEGKIYLVNRDQMTSNNQHFCPSCQVDPVVQEIPNTTSTCSASSHANCLGSMLQEAWAGMWSMPAYWNGYVYFDAQGDVLKAFTLTNGLLSTTPTASSADINAYPGANMAVSANGTSGGVVWALGAYPTEQLQTFGELKAYNAVTLAPLYSTAQGLCDRFDNVAKFTAPLVVNGKVYVAGNGQMSVYGLNAKRYCWLEPITYFIQNG